MRVVRPRVAIGYKIDVDIFRTVYGFVSPFMRYMSIFLHVNTKSGGILNILNVPHKFDGYRVEDYLSMLGASLEGIDLAGGELSAHRYSSELNTACRVFVI